MSDSDKGSSADDFPKEHNPSDKKNDGDKSGSQNPSASGNSGNTGSTGGSGDNLSDQDVEKALAGFEDEFKNMDPFETELEGILGDKAKAAMLITPLQQPDLLSAFCVLADVSAWCIGSEQGAVAILKNLQGSSPESAAKDLTTVISGLSVVLAINRADKLEAKLWMDGKPGADFAPPLLFMNVADFVEDFMIGSTDLAGLRSNGLTVLDSGEMNRGEALKVIARHTKFRPGANGSGSAVVD